jgi:outer membrane protein assembly factor BamB
LLAGAAITLAAAACSSRPTPNPVITKYYPTPSVAGGGRPAQVSWFRALVPAAGGSAFPSTVTPDGDAVYASRGGQLYALDAGSGQQRWRSPHGMQVPGARYAPVAAGGLVYSIVRPTSEHRGVLHALDAQTGRLRWRFSGGSASAIHPPVAGAGLVFLQAAEALYALEPATGHIRWSVPSTLLPQLLLDGSTLALIGNRLYVTATPAPNCVGQPSPSIAALEAATGELRWSRPLAALTRPGIPVAAAPGSGLLLVDNAGQLSTVDAVTGAPRWRAATGAQSVPASAGRTVVLATDKRALALDGGTGRQRWAVGLPLLGAVSGAVADGNAVYLTGEGGVTALDLRTGHQQWRAAAQRALPPAVDRTRVYAFAGTLLYAFAR